MTLEVDVQPKTYNFEKCFENSKIYESFSKFLESSFNLELLNYIEQISDFNLLFSQTMKKQRAKIIMDRFINIDSDEEINIPGNVRKQTIEKYEMAKEGKTTFDFDIFYDSFKVVYNDIRFDAWTKYIFTNEFADITDELMKSMSTENFKQQFLSTEDEISKSIIDLEYFKAKEYEKISDGRMKKNSRFSLHQSKVSTVNIEFTSKDLDNLDIKSLKNKDKMNQMIVEMMTPFSGVQLSSFVKKQRKSIFGMINSAVKSKKNDNTFQQREFKKSDLVIWLANYLKIEVTNLNIEKIIKILAKYEVIEIVNNEKEHYCFKLKKKVVIVGCGFAGMNSAKLLRESFDVTVIDKNENMKFNISFFKLFSNPEYIKKLEIPMSIVAKQCKFIQGEVLHISPSVVYLKDNESISYDYLIVATGSKYFVPFPIKIDWENPKEDECRVLFPYEPKQIISNHKYLEKAKHIAIVGTGPVGVEITGEIASHFQNTKVTAITNASRLLERQSPSAHKAGVSFFKEFKNLEVLFNRSVVKVDGKKLFFKKSETEKLTKNVEEYLDVDVVIICVGLHPSTGMFKTLMSDSLDARGYVEVNDFFQVKYGQNNWSPKKFKEEMKKYKEINMKQYTNENENEELKSDSNESDFEKIQKSIFSLSLDDGISATDSCFDGYSNIFAIGDIVNLKDEKLAYFSEEHGKRAANCIKAAEFSKDYSSFKQKLVPYKDGKAVLQIISFGKKSIVMKGYTMFAKGAVVTKIKESVEHHFLHTSIPN
eukprot:gene5653-9469_t